MAVGCPQRRLGLAAAAAVAILAPGLRNTLPTRVMSSPSSSDGEALVHVWLPAALLGVPVPPRPSATAAVVTPTSGATITASATTTPAPTLDPTATTPGSGTETPTPTGRPTATHTPPPSPSPSLPPCLALANFYRDLAGLPPAAENPEWSRGDALHARYMVKTDTIGHSEDPASPYYTDAGNAAAANGNLYLMDGNPGDGNCRDAMASWMTGPFHMVGIIDPRLAKSGFGEHAEDIDEWHRYGAVLDVLRGWGEVPPGVPFPIYYPADGRIIPSLAYGGEETPDPLRACRGYTAPTGPPIALLFGTGSTTPRIGRTTFRDGDRILQHCTFNERTYPGADGRATLDPRDAVILMPRDPLTHGTTYTATIQVNGADYTWSFTASDGGVPGGAGRTASPVPASPRHRPDLGPAPAPAPASTSRLVPPLSIRRCDALRT